MKQKRFHRVILAGLFLLCSIIINTSVGYSGNHIRRVDFSKVVFIGDSLTAGFQNGGLSEEGQIHGYAALIAQQAEFDITLPLISEPGIPPKLQLKNVEPLVIEPAEELGGTRSHCCWRTIPKTRHGRSDDRCCARSAWYT